MSEIPRSDKPPKKAPPRVKHKENKKDYRRRLLVDAIDREVVDRSSSLAFSQSRVKTLISARHPQPQIPENLPFPVTHSSFPNPILPSESVTLD